MATTPARVRISHARAEPAEAESYSLLGEAALAAGKAGKCGLPSDLALIHIALAQFLSQQSTPTSRQPSDMLHVPL